MTGRRILLIEFWGSLALILVALLLVWLDRYPQPWW